MQSILIKIFKMLFKILIFLLKLFFCLMLSLLILYWNFIVITNVIIQERIDWQIILYLLFSIFVLLLIFILAFAKIKIKKKLLLSLLFFVWLLFPKFLPNVMKQFDSDFCMDTGICKEGISNMHDDKGNLIPINKANCIKCGYKWYEKDKSCDLRRKIMHDIEK